jgi:hypothetical protein
MTIRTITRLAAVAVVAAGLAACAGASERIATVTASVLPEDQLARLVAVCHAAEPALALAAGPAMPARVQEIAVYPQAYCGQLLAGAVPVTTDANTPSWLSTVLAGVRVAAQVAGVVLPLVL